MKNSSPGHWGQNLKVVLVGIVRAASCKGSSSFNLIYVSSASLGYLFSSVFRERATGTFVWPPYLTCIYNDVLCSKFFSEFLLRHLKRADSWQKQSTSLWVGFSLLSLKWKTRSLTCNKHFSSCGCGVSQGLDGLVLGILQSPRLALCLPPSWIETLPPSASTWWGTSVCLSLPGVLPFSMVMCTQTGLRCQPAGFFREGFWIWNSFSVLLIFF